eukprot:1028918-Pyramimonas_sp.AAC.1
MLRASMWMLRASAPRVTDRSSERSAADDWRLAIVFARSSGFGPPEPASGDDLEALDRAKTIAIRYIGWRYLYYSFCRICIVRVNCLPRVLFCTASLCANNSKRLG